jgi:acyl carrier protein
MDVLTTLLGILEKDYKIAPDYLDPQAQLSAVGIDSLGLLELMFKIEDTFHLKIPGDPPTNLMTIQDVCRYIELLVASQQGHSGDARQSGAKS